MNIRCLKCKGRGFCDRTVCAQHTKLTSLAKSKEKHNKTDFKSQSPAPFIGWHGYPNVNVGLLTPPEKTKQPWKYDSPSYWSKNNYGISSLVDIRSSLLNSRFKSNVKQPKGLMETTTEVGLASRPVDIDFNLEEKPRFRMQSDSVTAPIGPDGVLKKADITSNPKVHTKVEKVHSDTALNSTEAISYLFKKGFSENFLSKILSVGAIGVERKRKLVPTRWSITATDDTLGKEIIAEISNYNEINDYTAYFGDYLGNYYLIMLFPGLWSYELFETFIPSSGLNNSEKPEFMTDHETHLGRKEYAFDCAGGYYSVRLAVLEKLKKIKRRASCLAIRIITGDYYVPLGVWVTREAARKALNNRPINFSEKHLMLKYAKVIMQKKFAIPQGSIIDDSKIIKERQESLTKF